MYLNKLKLQKQPKLFKNRCAQILAYNDTYFSLKELLVINKNLLYIFFRNLIFIEFRIYKFFFLKLRKLIKKLKFIVYVLISCNHIFSKKSKNSRMGKGKGKLKRYVFKSKALKPIFIFYRISNIRVSKFIRYLNSKNKNFFFKIMLKLKFFGLLNSSLKLKKNILFNTGFINLFFFICFLKKILHDNISNLSFFFLKKNTKNINFIKSNVNYKISKHLVCKVSNKFVLSIFFTKSIYICNFIKIYKIFSSFNLLSTTYLNITRFSITNSIKYSNMFII